jgi:hypothetical protein
MTMQVQQHAAVAPVPWFDSASIRGRLGTWAVALFSVTMLMGAALLFLVQPMFAKLALPRLGGSPSVWNTCVLFFQTTLLLGYLYAHFSTRWLGARHQICLHLLLMLAAVTAFPLALSDGQPPTSNPVSWLLKTMTLTVGLPFLVVSTTAPLLQRWFTTLPMAGARDPYFLYSASNLGSMLGLLAYPFVLEPSAGMRRQTWLWAGGYLTFMALTALCAALVRVCARETQVQDVTAPLIGSERLSARTRLRWVILSFVPSSLMLGVTTHISTDIAAVPLLWVLPLAMYLGTFVLTFSPREVLPHRWLVRLQPLLIFGSLSTILVNAGTLWLIPLHLAAFGVSALVCHRELACRRPDVHHLTEFYLWISFGGMLGGVFNSLLAPQMFNSILEYPLVLALAALVRPSPAYRGSRPEPMRLIVGLPALCLLLCACLWAVVLRPEGLGIPPLLLACALVLTVAYMFSNRPAAFGAMALLWVAFVAAGRSSGTGDVILAARSFFGVHRVVDAPDRRFHLLQHGSTTHGAQAMPATTSCEPTGYYHPSGPIGQVFGAAGARFERVAVLGLGTGALACYAERNDRWTFYEIDPLVERIARDPRYFTYLQNSRGTLKVVLGDGRLSLQRAAPAAYDLIVLDAFSSDAIPVHLLTKEALELYMSRLRSGGVIAVHISNRYLDLEPALAALAQEVGLLGIVNTDNRFPDADAMQGRLKSTWIIMARTGEPLINLSREPGWRLPTTRPRIAPWTDDYSNVFQVLVLR